MVTGFLCLLDFIAREALPQKSECAGTITLLVTDVLRFLFDLEERLLEVVDRIA